MAKVYVPKNEYSETEIKSLNGDGFIKKHMNPQVLERVVRKKKNKEILLKRKNRREHHYQSTIDKQNRIG
ncbi:hypothetical protein KPL47_07960 [Clostridium estertheticum]|uniref:hypothetical protein n=1 Tax=Clostridium estertheticum TaxID=238834 RepID=UPI001C0D3AD4|nr:hypothetical protein [Clostridium estertheticum]MBU3176304.1 hypothetical protein [Clostridium estertheticum]